MRHDEERSIQPLDPSRRILPRPRAANGRAGWSVHGPGHDARELAKFWPVVQNMVSQDLRNPLPPVGAGLPLDPHQPDPDDGHADDGLLAVVRQDRRLAAIRDLPVRRAGPLEPVRTGCLTDCSNSIISNEGLIRKIYLPKLIFPLTKVLINLTTFGLSMVALYFLVWLLGAEIHTGDGDAAGGDGPVRHLRAGAGAVPGGHEHVSSATPRTWWGWSSRPGTSRRRSSTRSRTSRPSDLRPVAG